MDAVTQSITIDDYQAVGVRLGDDVPRCEDNVRSYCGSLPDDRAIDKNLDCGHLWLPRKFEHDFDSEARLTARGSHDDRTFDT